MFELNQLRSFVMVATELHFGRAAQRLNMTQPPLTRQIQMLERELDVPLFARTSRSVHLTPAGRAFLPEARLLLQQSEAAAQVARQAAQTHKGAISVGFIGAATYGVLPRLVARARAERPTVEVTLREMLAVDQLQALEAGRLDLGLMRPLLEPRGVETTCVARERLALALPLDHPLAVRRRPRLEQLNGEALILYSTEARYLRDLVTGALRAASVEPRIVQQVSHSQAVLSLVSTGIGLAIVPEETGNACFDNIVFRPLDLGEDMAAEMHAAWTPGNRNSALPGFRDLVRGLVLG